MLDDLLEGSHRGGVLDARRGRLDDKTRGEHLLDDVVVQVARDPGPVLEEQHALLVVPGLGQFERDRGVVGEGGGQLRVGLGEGSPSGATHHDQRPPDLLAAEQRQDHDRSGPDLAGEVDRATVDVVGGLGVDHPDGRPGPHHVLAQGAGGRISGVLDAGGVVTLGHRDAGQLGIDGLDHRGEVGLGKRVDAASDQAQSGLVSGEHPARDLRGGSQPLVTESRLPEEAGVLDRHPRRRRQCLDELLVLLGEGLGTGPGEIEAAVVLLAHPDGYAEEHTHQRVTPSGKPTDTSWTATSSTRVACSFSSTSPSRPRPSGRWEIPRTTSSVIPTWTNPSRTPSSPTTPSAP